MTARELRLCRIAIETTASDAEDVEGELEAGAPDLRRVAPAAEPAPQRPAELQPVRVRDERAR